MWNGTQVERLMGDYKEHQEENEKDTFLDLKWWSLEELKNGDLEFEPYKEILQLLESRNH